MNPTNCHVARRIDRAVRAGGRRQTQVSHLSAGRGPSGAERAGGGALGGGSRAGLRVAADQYPTRPPRRPWPRSCPRPFRRSAWISASRPSPTRTSATSSETDRRGISGWGTWPPTRLGRDSDLVCRQPPDWAGRSLAELGERPMPPVGPGVRGVVADRLDVSVVIDCMSEPASRRSWPCPGSRSAPTRGPPAGPPDLDAGRPHPRTYGSAARVLAGTRANAGCSRSEGRRQLTSVPAAGSACAIGVVRDGRSRTWSCSTRRRSRTRPRIPNRRATRPDRARHRQRPSRHRRRCRAASGRVACPTFVNDRELRRPQCRHGRHRDPAVARLPGGRCPTRSVVPRGPRGARRHPPGARVASRCRGRRRGWRDPERHIDTFRRARERLRRTSRNRRAPGEHAARGGLRDEPRSLSGAISIASAGAARPPAAVDRRRSGRREDEITSTWHGRPPLDRGGPGGVAQARARAAIERESGPRRGARRRSRAVASATSGHAGGVPPATGASRSRGADPPHPRRSRRSSSMSSPTYGCSATVRGSVGRRVAAPDHKSAPLLHDLRRSYTRRSTSLEPERGPRARALR